MTNEQRERIARGITADIHDAFGPDLSRGKMSPDQESAILRHIINIRLMREEDRQLTDELKGLLKQI